MSPERGLDRHARRACPCGGEVQLDSFDPLTRAEEWFMRCRACGALGPVSGSAAEAERQWKESAA